MDTIKFFYSIGSRYSYLASTQIGNIEKDVGCEFEWIPINSIRLIESRGKSPFEVQPSSGQYAWDYRELDVIRWANYYGIQFCEPRGRVSFDAEVLALAAVAASMIGPTSEYSQRLFQLMFVDPSVVTIDLEVCLRAAKDIGFSRQEFESVIQSTEARSVLNSNIESALALGAFGVPTFVYGKELFWGNDRLVLLKEFISIKGGQK